MPRGHLIIETALTATAAFQFLMLRDEFGSVRNDVSPILLWECVCTFEIPKKKKNLCLVHMYFKNRQRHPVTRRHAFICYWRNGTPERGSNFSKQKT